MHVKIGRYFDVGLVCIQIQINNKSNRTISKDMKVNDRENQGRIMDLKESIKSKFIMRYFLCQQASKVAFFFYVPFTIQ